MYEVIAKKKQLKFFVLAEANIILVKYETAECRSIRVRTVRT